MIEIEALSFRYSEGEFGLDVPSLAVPRGQTVALIGPSGSGKTTLLRLLSGLLEPTAGRVSIAGKEMSALPEDRRRLRRIQEIGLVFQEFELVEYLTALDNVLLPFRLDASLTLDTDARDRARQLLSELGLEDKTQRVPAKLSQGERQRTAIARALVTRPRLILADEPTGNLDPRNKSKVLDIFLAQVSRDGTTLITVTHDHGLLDRFDRVLGFNDEGGVTRLESQEATL